MDNAPVLHRIAPQNDNNSKLLDYLSDNKNNTGEKSLLALLSIDRRLLKITDIVGNCGGIFQQKLKELPQPVRDPLMLSAPISVKKPNLPVLKNPLDIPTPVKKPNLPVLKNPLDIPTPVKKPNLPVPTPIKKQKKDKETLADKLSKLRKNFVQDMKDNIKDLKKTSKRGTEDLRDSFLRGFLGPLNLIISPLSKIFGKDLVHSLGNVLTKVLKAPLSLLKFVGSKIGKKVKSKFSFLDKGKSVKPKRPDILKSNPETVWLADELNKKNKEDEKGGILGNIFKKLFGGIASGIGKLGSFLPGLIAKGGFMLPLVASIIWAVIDGFKGMKMAKIWGTSKGGAFIGGFLATTKSGWKGAFANAGKWALAGVTVGFLAGGPVGALIGGFVGAAVGGILGFIGGKKIAKATDAVGKFFVNAWEKIKDFFIGAGKAIAGAFIWLGSHIKALGKVIAKKAVQIFNSVKTVFQDIVEIPTTLVKSLIGGIKKSFATMFNKNLTLSQKTKEIFTDLVIAPFKALLSTKLISSIVSKLPNIGDKVGDFFSSALSSMMSGLKTAGKKATDIAGAVKDFAVSVFSYIKAGVVDFFTKSPVADFFKKYIVDPIGDFFTKISDFFSFIGESIKNPLTFAKSIVGGTFEKNFQDYEGKQSIARTLSSDEYQAFAKMQKKSFEKLSDADKVQAYQNSLLTPSTKVHDAIISPSGRIVRPDSDDTIIATKSPVKKVSSGNDSDIQILLGEINKKLDSKYDLELVAGKLDILISTIKNKPFNNIISNTGNSGIDFEKLRA